MNCMKINRIITSVVVIFSISQLLTAQEIFHLDYNHSIQKFIDKQQNSGLKTTHKNNRAKTLTIPNGFIFFDDFSYYEQDVYPEATFWADKDAYVNQTYPDSCISIGVATLDAMDEYGKIYAKNDALTPSDTLTSKAISLQGLSDSVYFSFFVQGGGKGDKPEENDSLIVEFYSSDSGSWYNVWDTTGYKSNTFFQVILKINKDYFSDNFRFRFRNYSSLDIRNASGGDESFLTNSDFWHIDYVQIKNVVSAEEMKSLEDLMIAKPLLPNFKDYFSIPYSHLQYAQRNRNDTNKITYRTYYTKDNEKIEVIRTFNAWNIYEGKKEQVYLGGDKEDQEDRLSYITRSEKFASDYQFVQGQDYGHYMKECTIRVGNDHSNTVDWNDYVRIEEIFRDYYAHDDGTAETGFGMPGNGGVMMRLAYGFEIFGMDYFNDTLTAIEIYFANSRNNSNAEVEFKLCVWESDAAGEPGDLIYPLPGEDFNSYPSYFPDTINGINGFKRYQLEKDIVISGDIYIGLLQISLGTLNIGYDYNSNSHDYIRINSGTGWEKVSSGITPGSLMMRPVFGHKVYTSINENNVDKFADISIYPNPVKDFVNIRINSPLNNTEKISAIIYDTFGKMVISEQVIDNNINISSLSEGIYIMQVQLNTGGGIYNHKLIKVE